MIMSSPLLSLPAALRSAISRAKMRPELSSNDRIRLANSTSGLSSLKNH